MNCYFKVSTKKPPCGNDSFFRVDNIGINKGYSYGTPCLYFWVKTYLPVSYCSFFSDCDDDKDKLCIGKCDDEDDWDEDDDDWDEDDDDLDDDIDDSDTDEDDWDEDENDDDLPEPFDEDDLKKFGYAEVFALAANVDDLYAVVNKWVYMDGENKKRTFLSNISITGNANGVVSLDFVFDERDITDDPICNGAAYVAENFLHLKMYSSSGLSSELLMSESGGQNAPVWVYSKSLDFKFEGTGNGNFAGEEKYVHSNSLNFAPASCEWDGNCGDASKAWPNDYLIAAPTFAFSEEAEADMEVPKHAVCRAKDEWTGLGTCVYLAKKDVVATFDEPSVVFYSGPLVSGTTDPDAIPNGVWIMYGRGEICGEGYHVHINASDGNTVDGSIKAAKAIKWDKGWYVHGLDLTTLGSKIAYDGRYVYGISVSVGVLAWRRIDISIPPPSYLKTHVTSNGDTVTANVVWRMPPERIQEKQASISGTVSHGLLLIPDNSTEDTGNNNPDGSGATIPKIKQLRFDEPCSLPLP